MNTKPLRFAVSLLALFAAAGLSAPVSAAADEAAAKAFAKKNDCFKCHAIDKTKKGPSYKKIAAKYKGKADAESKLFEQVTKPQKVKLEDGTEEDHKTVDPKLTGEIKNLVGWILAQ